MPKFWKWAALLLVPAILVGSLPLLLRAHGPYYQNGNFDPDYAYLVNALAVREGKAPYHWDHPGTTLHALGALAILSRTLGDSDADASRAVFQESEHFLRYSVGCLVILYAALFALSAGLVWRATESFALTILAVTFPMLHEVTWQHLARFAPDMLTLSLGLLMLALLLPELLGELTPEKDVRRRVSLAGLSAGLMVATKITCLPLFLIPVFLFARRSRGLLFRFFAITALSFSVVILFVLHSVLGEFTRYLLGWVWNLATHKGQYGMGEAGLPGAAAFTRGLVQLILTAPLAAITMVICGSLGVSAWRRFGAILALASVMALQFLLAAKQPLGHYLMPALPSLGFALLVFFRKSAPTEQRASWLRILACALPAILLFQAAQFFFGKETRDRLAGRVAMDELVLKAHCRLVPFYPASDREFALFFGNYWARDQFSETFRELFPTFVIFDPSKAVFLNVNREPVNSAPILKNKNGENMPLCLRGDAAALRGPPFPGRPTYPLGMFRGEGVFFVGP